MPEKRWVKLAELILWQDFEAEYASNFSQKMGAPAKAFRMASGALIIKERSHYNLVKKVVNQSIKTQE